MANAQTQAEKRGLVPEGRPPALAGVIASPQKITSWVRTELLIDRIQAMIDRDPDPEPLLRWFLGRDPEEPQDLIYRPKEEWGRLLKQSPAVSVALAGPAGEKELHQVRNAQIREIEETTLEEWLQLVVEYG